MTKRIPYYKLNNFPGLRDEISRRFSVQLNDRDGNVRLQARDHAISFMRESGFNVDDRLEWVTWSNSKEYLVSVLKWS